MHQIICSTVELIVFKALPPFGGVFFTCIILQFDYDLQTTNNEETFLQDFLKILNFFKPFNGSIHSCDAWSRYKTPPIV